MLKYYSKLLSAFLTAAVAFAPLNEAQAQAVSLPADQAVVVPSGVLSSRGGFLAFMEQQTPEQRQEVMNALMKRNPHALTEMIYHDGERNALYESEYDKAQPHNAAFFKDTFVTIVRNMNTDYDVADATRFAVTRDFTARRLFDTISQGWPEPFKSTFDGLFSRLTAKMRQEGTSFSDILAYPGRREKLTDFLDAVSVFESADEFWNILRPDEQNDIVNYMLANIESGNDRRYVYTLAEFLRALPVASSAHGLLEQKIRQGFETSTGTKKDTYGVLARWYTEMSPHTFSLSHQPFYAQIKGDPRYQLERPPSIGGSTLFDAQGRHFQIHVFYSDADGINAYNGFMESMRDDGWSARGAGSGIAELEKRIGERVIKSYVSEPAQHGRAVPAIKNKIAAQGGVASVFVQRGHSYYVVDAAQYLDQNIRLGIFGACGVSTAMQDGVEMFPKMQITGSSGVGRGAINNSLILQINNQLLRSGSVQWASVERYLDGLNGGREYFTPPENNVQILSRTLNAIEDGNRPAPSPVIASTLELN